MRGDRSWYTREQLNAFREWLAARTPPFWTPRETADALIGIDSEEDCYIILDETDPEL